MLAKLLLIEPPNLIEAVKLDMYWAMILFKSEYLAFGIPKFISQILLRA